MCSVRVTVCCVCCSYWADCLIFYPCFLHCPLSNSDEFPDLGGSQAGSFDSSTSNTRSIAVADVAVAASTRSHTPYLNQWTHFRNGVEGTVAPTIIGTIIPLESVEMAGTMKAQVSKDGFDMNELGCIFIKIPKKHLKVGDFASYLPDLVPMIIQQDEFCDEYEPEWFSEGNHQLEKYLNTFMKSLANDRGATLKQMQAVITVVPEDAMLHMPTDNVVPGKYIRATLRKRWVAAALHLEVNSEFLDVPAVRRIAKKDSEHLLVPHVNPMPGVPYVGVAYTQQDPTASGQHVEFTNEIMGFIPASLNADHRQWSTVAVKLRSQGCLVKAESSDGRAQILHYNCMPVPATTRTFQPLPPRARFGGDEESLCTTATFEIDEPGQQDMWKILYDHAKDLSVHGGNGNKERTMPLSLDTNGLSVVFTEHLSCALPPRKIRWASTYDEEVQSAIENRLKVALGYTAHEFKNVRFSCTVSRQREKPIITPPKIRFTPNCIQAMAPQKVTHKYYIGIVPISHEDPKHSMELRTWTQPWSSLNPQQPPTRRDVVLKSNHLYIMPAEMVHQEVVPKNMMYVIIYICLDATHAVPITDQCVTFVANDDAHTPLSDFCN